MFSLIFIAYLSIGNIFQFWSVLNTNKPVEEMYTILSSNVQDGCTFSLNPNCTSLMIPLLLEQRSNLLFNTSQYFCQIVTRTKSIFPEIVYIIGVIFFKKWNYYTHRPPPSESTCIKKIIKKSN